MAFRSLPLRSLFACIHMCPNVRYGMYTSHSLTLPCLFRRQGATPRVYAANGRTCSANGASWSTDGGSPCTNGRARSANGCARAADGIRGYAYMFWFPAEMRKALVSLPIVWLCVASTLQDIDTAALPPGRHAGQVPRPGGPAPAPHRPPAMGAPPPGPAGHRPPRPGPYNRCGGWATSDC
jgi:hypothetical protein